jgi:peptidoglycan/xylan/chitin deacetylase (PgdA/CDA1 family)
VKRAAGALDGVLRPPPGVVVLIYHRVGSGSGSEVDLPLGLFEEQMALLAETGRVEPLANALEVLGRAGPPEGPLPVVVTFDDGTADFAEQAVPVLVRHRIPATLYVATAFLGDGRAGPPDGERLSWSALADTLTTGLVDVGSHTHGHRLLDRLPEAEVEDELDRSIELVGEHLGRVPLDFAYPKALPGSPAADRAVRRRFRSAALAGTRPNRVGATDPHRLARSPVQRSDGMRWFRSKVAGGMALEDSLRRLANRRRYAGATT